jgi:hypothetical protein
MTLCCHANPLSAAIAPRSDEIVTVRDTRGRFPSLIDKEFPNSVVDNGYNVFAPSHLSVDAALLQTETIKRWRVAMLAA